MYSLNFQSQSSLTSFLASFNATESAIMSVASANNTSVQSSEAACIADSLSQAQIILDMFSTAYQNCTAPGSVAAAPVANTTTTSTTTTTTTTSKLSLNNL